jgi:hypothetical protein
MYSSRVPRPCVLTVFPHREPRDLVREGCAALVPSARVLDAASPTDAVMTLLSTSVDLVLVDVDGAGGLMAALTRHVQRSAPDATLVGFSAGGGRCEASDATEVVEAPGRARPWSELPGTLSRWLQQWELRRAA